MIKCIYNQKNKRKYERREYFLFYNLYVSILLVMNSFTLKDLENLSGVKAHTLRIWEQRYSFLKPSRTFTNISRYSNLELKTILNIALLNKYGFKISHIDKMTEEERNEKILSLDILPKVRTQTH